MELVSILGLKVWINQNRGSAFVLNVLIFMQKTNLAHVTDGERNRNSEGSHFYLSEAAFANSDQL